MTKKKILWRNSKVAGQLGKSNRFALSGIMEKMKKEVKIVGLFGYDKSQPDRFEIIKRERFLNSGDIMVLADKETGVQYLFVWPVNSAGGLTVLVDADGKPVLSKKQD